MRAIVISALLIVAVAGSGAAASNDMCDDPPCSKAQIQAYEQRVSKHMLRSQQRRFEALARGDTKRRQRLDREFKRTQRRWVDAKQALQTAGN